MTDLPLCNIYCDESCHLENDGQRAMVLGGVWGPPPSARRLHETLRRLKADHGFAPGFEVKWTKVSTAKVAFYRAVLDAFFDDDDLHFRGVLVPNKAILCHEDFDQDHDTWYYKMYYLLLRRVLEAGHPLAVYLDIKDTRSQAKVLHLQKVLRSFLRDHDGERVRRIQQVRSHEIAAMQVCDLLIGAIGYQARGFNAQAKRGLVAHIQERAGLPLARTGNRGDKFDLLVWRPNGEPR